jgi:C4-dicarboxylate-specific signal transduction histidine kinase
VDISERKKQELKLLKAKEELERINNTLEQSVAERTKQLTEVNTQLLKVQKGKFTIAVRSSETAGKPAFSFQ